MTKKKVLDISILEVMYETAKGLDKAGGLSGTTMREIEMICEAKMRSELFPGLNKDSATSDSDEVDN